MERLNRKELIGKEITINELDKMMEDYTGTQGSLVKKYGDDQTFYKTWDIKGTLVDSYIIIFKIIGVNKIKIVGAQRV